MNCKKAAIILLSLVCVLLTVQTVFCIEDVMITRKFFLEDLAVSSDAVSQWLEPALSEPDEKEFVNHISGGKHAVETFYNNCRVNNWAFTYNILWHKESYLGDFTQNEFIGIKNRYTEIYGKCQDGTPLSDSDRLFLEDFNKASRGLAEGLVAEDGNIKLSVTLSKDEFRTVWHRFIEETKFSGYYG